MKQVIIILFFCSKFSSAFSQWSSYPSDSALWESPLSEAKAIQYSIGRIIEKEKKYHRIRREVGNYGRTSVKFGTTTKIYEFDRQGYPVTISFEVADQKWSYEIKNEYKDSRLVRSECGGYVYVPHYNSANLRDTCTWYRLGESRPFFQRTYVWDSLGRKIQSDVYNSYVAGFRLETSKNVAYDEKGRPYRIWFVKESRMENERGEVSRSETSYDDTSQNSTTLQYGYWGDTIFFWNTIWRGNKKRNVIKRSNNKESSDRILSIENVSEKGGKRRQRIHIRDYDARALRLRTYILSDTASDFVLKKIRFSPRALRMSRGRILWRRLLFRRISVASYIYVKHNGKEQG